MIIGIYGYQDSGKTVLVEGTIKALTKKGYRVSSIKHSPHKKSADTEGKDTWRHWKAGSDPVAFSSDTETTVFRHGKMSEEDIARLLVAEFSPDVVIIEGFKDGSFPKVSVGDIKARKGTVLRSPSVDELAAYIERGVKVERALQGLPRLDCHRCGLDCRAMAEGIADGKRKVTDCRELPKVDVFISAGGERIPAGTFVADLVDKTVRGLMSSLRGYEAGMDVEIRLSGKASQTKSRRGKGK
ncbi:MAG: molybdopterin-guanine dinucleotide biosynthesis protein B [Thermoplasmata archaeon]|nr:molybdopterin-guanine dinucleotide biosynthesis protein B [Thermoplasmata archaeon]